MKLNKFFLTLLAVLMLPAVSFADIVIQEDGTQEGKAKKMNFSTGMDVSISGGVATVTNGTYGASIELEGATADAYETTITVTDPTADRTVTIPNVSGTAALFQASFSATKLFVASDAVASGQTSKAVTVTGITTAAKCFAAAAEVATNAVYIRAVVPTANTATVTTSGDPGASNLDIVVLCAE